LQIKSHLRTEKCQIKSLFANRKAPNMNANEPNKGAGKGDKPRNCFSDSFKNNYNSINWKIKKDKALIKKELKNKDGSIVYIYE